MNKSCARCTKVVYPLEELKCLDKIWHKTCFKCHECGMVLNMKTYKGYNKLPYCEAHIPKAKATAIADTPELKRIAENTKIQSNIKYHAEFEKQKGKVTQVADDPETLRIKQNTKIISNVAYHGDLEKKAAMEKQRGVAEIFDGKDPELEYFSEAFDADPLLQYQPTQPQNIIVTSHTNPYNVINTHYQDSLPASALSFNFQHQEHDHIQSLNQSSFENNAKSSSGVTYHPISIQQKNEQQPQMQSYQAHRPTLQQSNFPTPTSQQFQDPIYQQPNALVNNYVQMRTSIVQNAHLPSGGRNADTSFKYYDQFENYHLPKGSSQIHISKNHSNESNNKFDKVQQSNVYKSDNNALHTPQTNGGVSIGSILNAVGTTASISGIGKIADYDPLTDGPRNIPSTPRQSATLIYSSDPGAVNANASRKIGSIIDIDPANGIYSSIVDANNKQNRIYQDQSPEGPQRIPQITLQSQLKLNPKVTNRRIYRALYDYEAQDSDEVSFTEGDLIFEIEPIDSGWLTGKVERTGKTGMLPANYIQPAMI